MQVLNQIDGVVIVFVYDAIVSLIILKIVDIFIGLRVSDEVEREGLDLALHGETVHMTEIRLGRRPGTALAVEGPQRKPGPLTFLG